MMKRGLEISGEKAKRRRMHVWNFTWIVCSYFCIKISLEHICQTDLVTKQFVKSETVGRGGQIT